MKKIWLVVFALFSIGLLAYLALPQPPFPNTLWDFVVSQEPADNETPLRRGYFTNLTREQLMSHYKKEFGWGISLNYPPEEAKILIRDQTQSNFLEEVVHPLRESLFVNGYEPPANKTPLIVDGVQYKQKVIVKYVGSDLMERLGVGVLTLALIWALSFEWRKELKNQPWTSQ